MHVYVYVYILKKISKVERERQYLCLHDQFRLSNKVQTKHFADAQSANVEKH